MSIADVTVLEGTCVGAGCPTTTASVTVTLSAASPEQVSVDYSTADGTATAPLDYTPRVNILTFAPGVTSQTIAVPVVQDAIHEPNETFAVSLRNPAGATLARGQAIVTIVDDDPPPAMSISDAAVAEGNAGRTLAYCDVMLSNPTTDTVTVSYATADGTATAGSDYVARTGTLTFRPGQTVETAILTVNGDATVEPDETFFVNLSGASGATIADAQGTATIENDDPPGSGAVVPQYRLFNRVTHEHLYTADLNEYDVLGANGWLQEGQAYQMLTSTASYNGSPVVPLFRLYQSQSQQHLWTTDANEATVLGETPDYTYEGISGYVLPTQVSGTTPLYRLYLASLQVHLWTTDQNEYTVLGAGGWVQEGIIGYVIP